MFRSLGQSAGNLVLKIWAAGQQPAGEAEHDPIPELTVVLSPAPVRKQITQKLTKVTKSGQNAQRSKEGEKFSFSDLCVLLSERIDTQG